MSNNIIYTKIYNDLGFNECLKKAQNDGYKITFCSEKNADESSYTSSYKYIQLENKMNKIIEINTTNDYAIVESGTTWFELIKELDKYNYTIISCQSGLNFSIGGSFCGNAHGKKTKTPMVKDTIIEFEYIDGLGNKHKVNSHNEIFNAFPGSLGLLGFITNIKLKIKKKYGIVLNVHKIPLNNKSIKYIENLSKNENVCMINFQCSYFEKIKEILLSVFYYNNCNNYLEPINISSFNEHLKIYLSFIIIMFWLMSKFEGLDETRWNIEKNALLSLNNNIKCINVNNSFDNWTKLYVNNFKIIEFFFPIDYFVYCQKTLMKIFSDNNMNVLSSGSRIVFEMNFNQGFLRFSQYATRLKPYVSLVINFIENKNNLENLTSEIREKIIKKNIKMTYHTTYSWNFTKEDILFMFPDLHNFVRIKKYSDPNNLFSNKFSEKYF
jgi:hypothetical protein